MFDRAGARKAAPARPAMLVPLHSVLGQRVSYRNICQRPTASKALGKCSISGFPRWSGQTIATTSNRLRDLEEVVLAEEVQRGEGDSPLLLRGDSLGGHTLAARLDLDEYQGVAVARDQVDLAELGAITPREHAQAPAAEEPRGGPLAAVTQQPVPERPHDRSHG